jgi:hypothetical protein
MVAADLRGVPLGVLQLGTGAIVDRPGHLGPSGEDRRGFRTYGHPATLCCGCRGAGSDSIHEAARSLTASVRPEGRPAP